MVFGPAYDLVGALVWRKNWIEDIFDPPVTNDQPYRFHEPLFVDWCRPSNNQIRYGTGSPVAGWSRLPSNFEFGRLSD